MGQRQAHRCPVRHRRPNLLSQPAQLPRPAFHKQGVCPSGNVAHSTGVTRISLLRGAQARVSNARRLSAKLPFRRPSRRARRTQRARASPRAAPGPFPCRAQCRAQVEGSVGRPSSPTTLTQAYGSPTVRAWVLRVLALRRCAGWQHHSSRPAEDTSSWAVRCSRRRWTSLTPITPWRRPRSFEVLLCRACWLAAIQRSTAVWQLVQSRFDWFRYRWHSQNMYRN